MKKRVLYAGILSFSLMTLLVRPGTRFIVNVTPSSPRGLYLVSRRPASVGDFVVINSDALPFNNGVKNTLFLKQVAFAGNEYIRITGDSLLVNGMRFMKYKNAGIRYEAPLRNDQCIILGTHERSFDSRYFGPVSLASCTRVVPVFLIDRL